MLNTEKYVLKAYSDGHIGWREACRRLDFSKYAELENALKINGFSDYLPKSNEYINNIKSVETFLYDDWDINHDS